MEYYRPLGNVPRVIDETESYSVLYKPPLMFSAPLGSVLEATLLGWYGRRCPAVLDSMGGRKGEGGILHRLDFETEGLVLFAKTQDAYESLTAQQRAGEFVKEYLAAASPGGPAGRASSLPGFPPPPDTGPSIESYFRPWGPGRKAVRPVTAAQSLGKKLARDRGGCYRTEILAVNTFPPDSEIGESNEAGQRGLHIYNLRIRRGFRHQIRCHLAWIGEPILYDTLYGWEGRPDYPAPLDAPALMDEQKHPIALRAAAVCFFDPDTGKPRDYRLPGF